MTGQRRGPVGAGYMPKGGARAAIASNERVTAARHAAEAAAASEAGTPEAARTRGRGVSVEGLALVGAVSGVGSALCLLFRALVGA